MKFYRYLMEDVLESIIDYRGKTPKKSETGIRTLSAKSVKNNYIDYSSCYFISQDEYQRFMVRGIPQKGDILLTTEAPLGNVAKLDTDNVAIAQRLLTLRGKNGILDNDYLMYYLQSPLGQYKLKSKESGTTVTGIKQSEFRKIVVEIPDYEMQKKIVDILNSLNLKITLNRKINKNLEQHACVLYKSIVENASVFMPLSEYASIKHGFAFKGDFITFEPNDVILVTPGNFKIGGGFQENKCKYFTSKYPADYVLHPNDLIVTMTDLSKDADTLGYSAFVPNNPDRVYLHNQRIGLVQFLTDVISKDYVYWFLRSYDYHMRIVGSSSGSTVKHTSPGRILEQMIPIPKEDDKGKILLLNSINKAIAANDLENTKLSSIRDSLLPRIMEGKIDVSALDF